MLWHLNENRKKLEKFLLQFTVIWNWHRKKKFSPRNKQNCEFAKVKKKKKEKKSPNFSCFIVTRLEQSKLINMKCPVKQNFNGCSHWTHNCLALFTAFWGGGVAAERETIRRQQNVKGRLKLTTDEGGGGMGWGIIRILQSLMGDRVNCILTQPNSFDSFPIPTPQAINNEQPLGIPPCDWCKSCHDGKWRVVKHTFLVVL